MTDRNDAQRQAVLVPRQDGHFAGRVAFITGATSGIDRATDAPFFNGIVRIGEFDAAAATRARRRDRLIAVANARSANRPARRWRPLSAASAATVDSL
jgi:hypothetical protein